MSPTEKSPLVSVIITTFNRSKYLEECLDSIVNQTYRNIEVLVIDDGSEHEISIVNKNLCSSYLKCIYFYKKNTGQPDSRNYGIQRSKGSYIAFCDDDDYWVIDKLEKQVNVLENNIEYGLVTGSIEYVNSDGTKTGNLKTHKGHNHGYIFKDLLIKNRTDSITPLLRREIFKKIGYFNTNFTIAEDWEFWRRVSYYYKFYFIDEVMAYVRLHDKNMSLSRKETVLERYKLYRKLTNSLLIWGEGRFSKKEKRHIEYIEWCHYRKLFSNNLSGLKRKSEFLIGLLINDYNNLFRILKLFVKYNKVRSKNK